MTTKQINEGLKIVKLKGDIKFVNDMGYYLPKGYCFRHSKLGYLSFDTDYPYMPSGGKRALEEILESGAFTDFDNIKWLKGA